MRSDLGGAFWSLPAGETLKALGSEPTGLTPAEARLRLSRYGRNTLADHHGEQALAVLLRQFRSPLVLILIFAASVSAFVGEGQEAAIIGAIVLASCVLSFTQEYGASRATEALKQRISRKV